ncbi:ATP-binding protein [Micromonospora olivasterospora]|uniref:Histidine kinase/DNA gyrase B/HSP90-like ATPase n=1 Tax=Micromonospora olivasterospora TaxID=1880 RepID=A0A562I8T8_MICOL|nr:ATP-binding protein [Micromonospora olivasterospora]TWH67246.1 histidine kinase/DNA gyrase B/HSP90-like ATPase [Micromonospora olivasterospora]
MAEILLSVGEPKIRQFQNKKQIAAIAELVWNALDANATYVEVELERTLTGAVDRILVSDNGEGITPEQAQESFREYGDTWKSSRTHTSGHQRILHGQNGEGRLYAFSLGEHLTWTSIAKVDGRNVQTRITVSRNRPTVWNIGDPVETTESTGTKVAITVPQGKRHRALESSEAPDNLAARLAFYLRAYPGIKVVYDGVILDPENIIQDIVDLRLDLPPEYVSEAPPIVTFVEWKTRITDRKMLICNAEGIALAEYGEDWHDAVVSFTPYLRWRGFSDMTADGIHMLTMSHAPLLYAAEQAVRKHVSRRRSEISSQVVEQLKTEGLYPYDLTETSPTQMVERQTFDLVVTVARTALPPRGAPRQLSVNLIQAALERDPSDLHGILDRVLSLSPEERSHLGRLIDDTQLSSIISATNTIIDRLNFIGGLRKLLADPQLRRELREVDQLHPMIAKNLWLFGEEWTLARTEVGLTSVLREYLHNLGEAVTLENELERVAREDGRSGRVDILLFRGIGDERHNERLVVELKRPTVKVGRTELDQVKSYARAIVDDPQYRGVKCKWKFILATYDYDEAINRDIRQRDKPPGLADDQEEYELWVYSWGELLDAAERKLFFFRKQLEYEATDERVTRYLRESYQEYIPETLHAPSAQE